MHVDNGLRRDGNTKQEAEDGEREAGNADGQLSF